jgi:hypothetical protein
MNYSDYQDFIVSQINAETGLDLVWDDFTLSNPIPVNGKTIEVTITPTQQGSSKVKGEARFKIDRMDLSNQVFVYDWEKDNATSVSASKAFGAALSIHDRSPKTLSDVLQLLNDVTGIPFLDEDFESLTVTPDDVNDVVFTLSAKADSLYYFGVLTVRLSHPWVTHAKFRNGLGSTIQVTAAQLGYGTLVVDGVQVSLPYSLPAGEHDIEVYHFNNVANGFKFLGPTHLKSLGLFYDKFDGLFRDCLNLTTIDSECIRLNGSNLQATNIFRGCLGLSTLPNSLFAKNSEVRTIDGFFQGSGLTTVNGNLFQNLEVIGNTLSDLFNGCSKLTTLGLGLLDPIVKHTTTSIGLFAGCAFKVVNVGLLSKMTQVTVLGNTFLNCVNLEAIPVGLLDKLTLLKNSSYVFRGCSGLKSVPESLFKPLVSLATLIGTFRGCTGIQSVPETLLTANIELIQISELFSGSGLLAIPPELLTKQTKLVHASSCFASTSIVDIPVQLFENCPMLSVLVSLFDDCGKLMNIPELLFAHNQQLVDVTNAFRSVPAPLAVPSNFFPGLKLARAGGVFRNSGIVSIPARFLQSHTTLSDLSYAFAGTKLTTLPSYVVTGGNNTLRDVSHMFEDCKELVSIANSALNLVFTMATNQAGNCANMLRGCTKLTTLAEGAIRISGYVGNFDNFMENCSELRIRDTDLLRAISFFHNTPTTTVMSFVGMFQNFKWLEGKCTTLWDAVRSGGVAGNSRKNTNFIERCFLLEDYTAVGKPWWTTPLNLSLASGGLPVFKLDDVKHGIASYVPLYSTYYCNVPRDMLVGIINVDKEPIVGITKQRLASLFFSAGLLLPTEATTVSVYYVSPNSPGIAALLRPEVKSALLVRLNDSLGSNIASELRNPQNYLFCTLTT